MKKILLLILLLQSCKIGIDKDQPQDSFKGEIVLSDNLTDKVKLGDTITVSYRQPEVFDINNKKYTVYEEDIEKFYLSLLLYTQDDTMEGGQRELKLGGELFTIIQERGEYNYSRLYPKFDIKAREYVGKFKIVFKRKGLFLFSVRQDGILKFKNINAFTVFKLNKPYNLDIQKEFVANRPETERKSWIASYKYTENEGTMDGTFFRVE